MTAPNLYYVCDMCGTLHEGAAVPEGGEWTCEGCGSHRAWEFPSDKRRAAVEHAAHISRGIGKGGIFRHARAV